MTQRAAPAEASPVPGRLTLWWLAARPKTLPLSVAPVLLATALAYADARAQPGLAGLAALGAMCIQIGTNFVNDWADAARGADAPDRLGPLRVTQAGLLPLAQVRRAGWCAFALAGLCGCGLVLAGGWVLVAVGLASLAAGYCYTAGPYPLAYHGLGELFAGVFFGPVSVGTTYFLQAGVASATSLWLGAAVGAFAAAVLAINNLRDREQDARVGKRTLAVRLSPLRARQMILGLLAFPYAVLICQLATGALPLACAAALPTAGLAAALGWRCMGARGAALNALLAGVARLQAMYCLLLSMALAFVAGTGAAVCADALQKS